MCSRCDECSSTVGCSVFDVLWAVLAADMLARIMLMLLKSLLLAGYERENRLLRERGGGWGWGGVRSSCGVRGGGGGGGRTEGGAVERW